MIQDLKTYDLKELKIAEEHVLSAFIFYYPEIIELVDITELSHHLFHTPSAKEIFKILNTCEVKNGRFDILLIFNHLKQTCNNEELLNTHSQYLERLNADVQYYNIKKYITLLQENQIKSKLNALCKEIINTKLSTKQFTDSIQKWEKNFFEITNIEHHVNYITSEEAVEEYSKQFDNQNNPRQKFLSTGFWDLDSKIKGFKPGQFVVIASRPGIGKTTFALNLICNNLIYIKKKKEKKESAIGIFSLEMTNKSLIEKIIAIDTKIELKNLQKWMEGGSIPNFEIDLINNSKKMISNSNLLFCDESNITLGKIAATIKIWARQYNIKVVFIDYLQLINLPNEKDYNVMNQYQKIGMITRYLKILTMELNICIVTLAQLNRKSEDRKSGDKSPMLSDLRESGSIEQDSDIVLFLYPQQNQENYDNPTNESNESQTDISLKVGKNRHGGVGTINFSFEKKSGIFSIKK